MLPFIKSILKVKDLRAFWIWLLEYRNRNDTKRQLAGQPLHTYYWPALEI